MSALSDALTKGNAKGLSARAVSRIARERGHSLNHDTAARYLRGDHGQPDEPTLVAFADVLGVPLGRLRRAAGLPADETAPYVPPPEASRLSRRQRRAVDEIIRAMLEPTRTAARTASETASERRAARRGRAERTR
jgi:cytochrome P450